MKRRIEMLAVALAVSACRPDNRQPVESYQRWTDQMIVRLGLPNIGIWPCSKLNGKQCYKMTPPRRWRGIWVNGFENSLYCEVGTKNCNFDSKPATWLDFSYSLPAREKARLEFFGGVHLVEFIGRRTIYPGSYGHMGAFEHEIVVDRMIVMKELKAPPRALRKEQMEAVLAACQAAGTCTFYARRMGLIEHNK